MYLFVYPHLLVIIYITVKLHDRNKVLISQVTKAGLIILFHKTPVVTHVLALALALVVLACIHDGRDTSVTVFSNTWHIISPLMSLQERCFEWINKRLKYSHRLVRWPDRLGHRSHLEDQAELGEIKLKIRRKRLRNWACTIDSQVILNVFLAQTDKS